MSSKNVRGWQGHFVGRPRVASRRGYRGEPRNAASPAASEALERRLLMAVSVGAETYVNVSRARGNQSEGTIAIDPTNPNRLFLASNTTTGRDPDVGPNDVDPSSAALFGATSINGGIDWATREFANGAVFGGDGLPAACCDPSAEFDQFGNLFVVYLSFIFEPNYQGTEIDLLHSTDGGQTFALRQTFRGIDLDGQGPDQGECDQPSVATGANSVWITFMREGEIVASGAPVTGLGAMGAFIPIQSVPGSAGGNFGDIAVGPNGEVMVDYQRPISGELPSQIWTHIDRDGLGPAPFEAGVIATTTNVGGFDLIPAQRRRSVDAEANIEFDRSSSPVRGRVYMAYTNEAQFESITGNNSNLDVYVRFSDDLGTHWSAPFLVNDDVGLGSPQPRAQFLPQIALDQSTGKVGVGFHDARNDTGVDRDFNDDVQYFVSVGTPTADRTSIVFSPNVRVGVGQSDAKFADNGIDFGDYTGLAFYADTLYPAFADNSDVTKDNPAGARRSFDIYTGRVRVIDTPTPPPPFVTPASPLSPFVVNEKAVIRKGKFYNLTVAFTAPTGAVIDVATLGDNDLTATNTAGFNQNMQFRGFKRKKGGQTIIAKYRLTAPGGTWDVSDNAMYSIILNQDAIRASNGVGTAAGVLSRFLVDARPPGAGRSGRTEPAGAALLPVQAAVTPFRSKKDQDGGAHALLA